MQSGRNLSPNQVDEVIVSLDGPEEVHDQVRRVKGAFKLVHSGIGAVRRHNPAMPFHARTTIQKMNYDSYAKQ